MENTTENNTEYQTVEAEVIPGNDTESLSIVDQGLAVNDYPETEHVPMEDIIDTNAEVYDASTAGPGGSDVRVPEDAPFPFKVNMEELANALDSQDPGKFISSLAETVLVTGRIVSLSLQVLKGAKYERASVGGVDAEGVTLNYLDGQSKKWPFEKIKDIEILHTGQRFGTHELMYPMFGVSEEKMLPHLRALTSGQETHVKAEKEDGTVLNAKLRLYRSKEKNSKGRANMYAIYGADELVIADIPKMGIYFTPEQKAELREKGFLKTPVEVEVEKEGKKEKVLYKVVIDKDLNIVRVSRHLKIKQQEAVSKNKLIEMVKFLQKNGFPAAWIDMTSPEKIKEGILLHRGAGVAANLVMKGAEPKLEVTWKAPEDQGIGVKAYTEQYKSAEGKAKDFLAGNTIKQDENKETRKPEAKVTQDEKKKTGLRV